MCALSLLVVVGSVAVTLSVKVHDAVDMLREVLDPDAELIVVSVAKVEDLLGEGRADSVMKPVGSGTDEAGKEGTPEMKDETHDDMVGDAVVSQVLTSVSLAAGIQRS